MLQYRKSSVVATDDTQLSPPCSSVYLGCWRQALSGICNLNVEGVDV